MTSEQAIMLATEFNKSGKFADQWFYYPGWHEVLDGWFVCRRPKDTTIRIAVFHDGKMSPSEK